MMHNNGDLLSMLDKKILDDPKLAKELLLIERVIMEKSEKIVFVSNNACENFKAKLSTLSIFLTTFLLLCR